MKEARYFTNREDGFWWLMGVIYGDGHVRNDSVKKAYRIIIGCEKDFKDSIIRCNCGFHVSKVNENFYQVYLDSKKAVEYIYDNFKIKGSKSHTISLPEEIDSEDNQDHFWDFIRGYFDADGCILIERANRGFPKIKVKFSSVSVGMLKGVQNRIFSLTKASGTITCSKKMMNGKEKKCYNLVYRAVESVDSVLSCMYRNKGEYFLDRKFNLYIKYSAEIKAMRDRVCKSCNENLALTNGLCKRCTHRDKRKLCHCGERAVSNGVCRFMYDRYKRGGVLNILESLAKKDHVDFLHLIDQRNYKEIESHLRSKLISFYMAKHEGFMSLSEYWLGKDIKDIAKETSEARRNYKVKPASWFKVKDAVKILQDINKEYGIETIVDPFSGWGARAAAACVCELKYTGVDLNKLLVHEIQGVFKDIDSVRVMDGDSFNFEWATNVGKADLVFSCPPYWKAESYGHKQKRQRKFSTFCNDLLKLTSKIFQEVEPKVVVWSIEDFVINGKKYNFIEEINSRLEKNNFNVSIVEYNKMYRSYQKDWRSLYYLKIEKK